MYHIVNDKRAEKSAELLYSALIECQKKEPYNKITITDLQKTSYVSRATFYRLFDSIDDILVYKFDQQLNKVKNKINPQNGDETLFDFIQTCIDNKELIQVVLENDKTYLLVNSIKEKLDSNSILGIRPSSSVDTMRYDLSIFAGIILGALLRWHENGEKESTYQICEIIKGSIRRINNAL